MIRGQITERGIYFEIELVTSDGEQIPVDVLFDSGFTSGILAIHAQDIDAMGWENLEQDLEIPTAGGLSQFTAYRGNVIIDGQRLTLPVLAGDLPDEDRVLLGYQILNLFNLILDTEKEIATLSFKG